MRNIATKQAGRKDEHDLAREGLVHVIHAGISKSFLTEVLAYVYYLVNRLPSSAIGGKTPVKVWSERVTQDNNSLQVFVYPAYYQGRQVGPEGEKRCVRRIQERHKRLQDLGFEGQEVYLQQR